MSNMSYCRFENTASDLADCQGALEELMAGEHGKLSREELRAAKQLVESCCKVVSMFAELGRGTGFVEALEGAEPDDDLELVLNHHEVLLDKLNADAGEGE